VSQTFASSLPLVAACLLVALPAQAGVAESFSLCDCPTDFNLDGTTDASDLAVLLGAWGDPGPADLDGDGLTAATDLAILLGAWGPCAAPATDSCGAAAQVVVGNDLEVPFCTAAATTSSPPLPTSSCGGAVIGKDIWLHWGADFDGIVIFDTCDATFDTMLAVYKSTTPLRFNCPGPSLQLVACNDDFAPCGTGSQVTVAIAEDDRLTVRIGGYTLLGNPAEGQGFLGIKAVKRGDRCDIAHQLPSSTFQIVSGTNAGDTWIEPDQSSCASGDTVDEWYRFVMPCDGTVTFSTCDPGTTFDTTLAVFDACGGTQLACNDDINEPACQINSVARKSRVTLGGSSGSVFLIRVSGFQGATGPFKLIVDVDCVG
jgi:hypothetical protein